MATMAATQKDRPIQITTALGEDALLVRSFSVDEQLGRLFQMDLDLLSTDEKIDFDAIVGRNVTLRVDLPNSEFRYFNGFVNRFVQTGREGNYARYQATLVPWLWFLTRNADCKIFQSTMPAAPDMTAPGIIQKVFKDGGFNDFSLSLTETYRKRDYCVQYRETDFNFVSRLMEQEGIYYYFKHEDGKHTMVLADSPSAHDPFSNYESLIYRPDSKAARDREIVTDWVLTKEVQPGIYALNDFDFEKPKKLLKATSKIVAEHAAADYEIYDYPGEYGEYKDGETYARKRIEELHAKHEVARGSATIRGICVGCTTSLEDHPRDDQNREYLVTGTSYHFQIGEFDSATSDADADFCTCTFTAIPAETPFRSIRKAPKPMVQGVQTAIVVGPKGEEIHTDEQARVKVQFHWDRYGKANENSSCWVRVSQANAGKGWGSMITPRIGQEVIVEFLEGDPDRPIITGRVYNGDNKPPYASGQGVISGIKSDTHKGSGYNEISMDDTAGKEKITIHGQYDMDTSVENDQTNTVKNKLTEHVTAEVTEKYDKTQETTIKGKLTIKSTTDEILIDAAKKITLQTGQSKITMEASGDISIEGVNVSVSAKLKASTKGSMVESEGSATNKLKGGMVMIN